MLAVLAETPAHFNPNPKSKPNPSKPTLHCHSLIRTKQSKAGGQTTFG